MAGSDPSPRDARCLADRLALARHRSFVGRQRELDLFSSALTEPEPPFAVLHVFGPGGVGKSSLLAEYSRLAGEAGVGVVWLDGRHVDPSPPGFLLSLRQAMGLDDGASPIEALSRRPRAVLLVDTYESLSPLDAWLRESFLPQLPGQTVVVTAGRNRPAPAWRTEPGWRDLVRGISLRNLRPEESRAYLSARGVGESHHETVLGVTHGHPLALSLLADVLESAGGSVQLTSELEPNVVEVLLGRFVQQVPSPRHRSALEVCAHARVTTERLLAETLGGDDSPELFSWLRGLSFVEQGPEGLFPHDIVREVLDADLRWRNPERYRHLHRQMRTPIVRRIQRARGREQQQALFDLLYLHRNSPVMKAYNDWEALGSAYAEPVAEGDVPAILDMVRRHEGEDSARIAQHWLVRQPDAFHAFRGLGGDLIGFEATLALDRATPEELAVDPAAERAMLFAGRQGPIRHGEEMLHHRFHMGRETYQAVSSAMNLMASCASQQWLTRPRLAWSFLAVADAAHWHDAFTYLNFRLSPETGFAVGGREYAVYTHDWRAEPALAWLDLMQERELAMDPLAAQLKDGLSRTPPLLVLSQPEFEEAVRRALREYAKPAGLAANPLLRSRLVQERGGASARESLRSVIREAVEALDANPRDKKLSRALTCTYLEPAATQELAAERLGLPFSTYRLHLTTGIARVIEGLWRRELAGFEG